METGLRVVEPTAPAQLERYYELRWRVLRAPLKQPRGSERDARDATAIHLMACRGDGAPLGVARLHFVGPHQAQLRYMAVESRWRGHGIGHALLEAAEARAAREGVRRLVLDARENAVGFYQRYGYRIRRPAPTLHGRIRHWRMEKPLARARSRG